MQINLIQLLVIAGIAFAAWQYYKNNASESLKSKVNTAIDKSGLDDLVIAVKNAFDGDPNNPISTSITPNKKLELLRQLIFTLDAENDKDKIDYLLDNFGKDFLREFMSNAKK